MAHCTVIGKIVFSQKFERKDVVELSYFLMQKAIDNRIGINLYCNLTRKAEYFYPIKSFPDNIIHRIVGVHKKPRL